MQPLTDRQEAILDFIRRSIKDRGYPPTLREIGAQMGIRSTNGVSDHLRALERKGYISREDMKSRALRPTSPPPAGDDAVDEDVTFGITVDAAPANNVLNIPLVGRVAAGPLTFASHNIEQQILMDPSLLRGASGGAGETFALRVRGDSMIDAGIYDGDILFVRRQETATRGEIVVALVGEEATVKRFYQERDHIRLQPENKRLGPIYVRRGEMGGFRILGVVVGLFRSVAGSRLT